MKFPPTVLILHCGGFFANEGSTGCMKSVEVRLPLTNIEAIGYELAKHDWIAAFTNQMNEIPFSCHPMCLECARKIMPELVAEMERNRKRRPS